MLRQIFHPFLLCLCILTTAPSSSFAEGQEAGPLSHEALFAPNKTFPYFESFGEIQAGGEFDLSNAAFFAQCSLLSYVRETEFIAETLAKACFNYIEFFDTDGTFAFLAESEDAMLIVFRGTESGDQTDYLTDAKIIQTQFNEKGTAHSGFVAALAVVQADLTTALEKRMEQSPGKPLYLAGHSLGGALATLFGIQNMDRITSIYTIGSPRIVGRSLAEAVSTNLPLYRFVNDNDIVPRVPTPPTYQHIGTTYFITPDGELLIDPTASIKWRQHFKGHRKRLNQMFEEHWSKGDLSAIPSDFFVDHSPRLYTEAIIKLASEQSSVE